MSIIKARRPVLKNKLNEWYDWLLDYGPKSIKSVVSKAFSKVKNSMLNLYSGAKNKLKDAVKKETEKKIKNRQKIKLIGHLRNPSEHWKLQTYKSFGIPGLSRGDIDDYFN